MKPSRSISPHCQLALFVASAFVASSCRCNVGNSPIPIAASGAEDWSVDGVAYHVSRTYYVRQGMQQVVYVIEHSIRDKSDLVGSTDDGAMKLALPLIKYAYQSRAYERLRITSVLGTEPTVTSIGVDLVANANGKTQGYRVVQSVSEIARRLKDDQPGQ